MIFTGVRRWDGGIISNAVRGGEPPAPDSPFTHECRIRALYKFQGFATVRFMHLISAFGRRGGNPTCCYGGGDRMTIWIISIAGVIVGVIATDTPITDPKAKLLLGLVLMGIAIHLQCGSGKRG